MNDGEATAYREGAQGVVPCRPRQVIAAGIKRSTRASWIRSLVLDHLRAAEVALPEGRRGAVVRGRDVAEAALGGASLGFRRSLGDIEGTAADVLSMMWGQGLLRLRRCPCPAACDQAMRRLVRVSPLFVRVKPGLYRLVLTAYRVDVVHDDRLAELRGLQTADAIRGANLGPRCRARGSREAEFAAGSDARAASAPVAEDTPLAEDDQLETGPILVCGPDSEAPSYTRAPTRSHDVEGFRAPDGECGASVDPPALGRSAAAAAFARLGRRDLGKQGGQAAPTSPSGGRLRRFSASGWLQALPKGKHVRRLADLLLRHLAHVPTAGSAREIVERLAWRDGRWTTRRERAGCVRALQGLQRRGLVVFEVGAWRLPELTQHPALKAARIPSRPSARTPSAALIRWLDQLGLEAEGLSHGEAVLLQRRIWSLRQAGDWTCVGTILRVAREHQREQLPADLRGTGGLGEAADRRQLEAAMAERMLPIWGDC